MNSSIVIAAQAALLAAANASPLASVLQDGPSPVLITVGGVVNAADVAPSYVNQVNSFSNNSWQVMQPIPSNNLYLASATDNGGLVFALTANTASKSLSLLTYDIGTNTWNAWLSPLQGVPYTETARTSYNLAVVSQSVYLFTHNTNTVYAIDKMSKSVQSLQPMAYAQVGCVVPYGTSQVIVMNNGNSPITLLFNGNGTGTPQLLASRGPNIVSIDACVLVGDKVVVIGSDGQDHSMSEQYDISKNSWSATTPPQTTVAVTREMLAATLIPETSNVLLCGGQASQKVPLQSCEQLDVSNATAIWQTSTMSLPQPLALFGLYYVTQSAQTTTPTTPVPITTTTHTNAAAGDERQLASISLLAAALISLTNIRSFF